MRIVRFGDKVSAFEVGNGVALINCGVLNYADSASDTRLTFGDSGDDTGLHQFSTPL